MKIALNKVVKGFGSWQAIWQRPNLAGSSVDSFKRCLQWIDRYSLPGAGIAVTDEGTKAYPEVTGYFIPTLLGWGERKRALEYARWLLAIQNADGSWSDPSGMSAYTFDTGQILKGLLNVLPQLPEAREAIQRGCDWMLSQFLLSGRIVTPDTREWNLPNGRMVPEAIHLYAIEPLRKAAVLFDAPVYGEAVERALGYYLRYPSLTKFNTLSHFYAYVLEALIDLGYLDRAVEGLADIQRYQRHDGAVPAYPETSWVCSTGLAQYAVVCYRLGQKESAEGAFRYLSGLQTPSGGFLGSYGRGANYFAKNEISWAVKYYLDALLWRIQSDFDESSESFPNSIDEKDGRFRLVEDVVHDAKPDVLLDIGCGKGRFIRLLKERNPSCRAIGLDISEAMLAHLPDGIEAIHGSQLCIPLPDGSVDLAFCVETLEHAVNVRAAIQEMSRVLRSPGTLVIIDKNVAVQGRLRISEWEQWFEEADLATVLRDCGFEVTTADGISYETRTKGDGLFLGWIARK